MEAPTVETVLGNFNDVEFRYLGKPTFFSKSGDSFRITTENQQGKSETFTVVYTLGYKPLQQYLVDAGGGRIQALPFAWDSREAKDGGQQWFHLYPKENVTPDNPLFWTRSLQNWNHMCGDCHTTGFSKNFSESSGQFKSQWSEAGNGCESCHGAGSAHVAARQSAPSRTAADTSITALRGQQAQIDQCGVCHSRRVRLGDSASHNRPLEKMLETWKPQLPQDPLYFVDGQIRDEVFEIGSFLQSRMAAKGVACTDCHDPHTARLKAEGNALCIQCHEAKTFDTSAHHFHRVGTPGAQCVECHMPSRTYMVVDPRRDHRFAIPRPDLSASLGAPSACGNCHQGQTKLSKGAVASATTLGTAAWQAIHEQANAAETLRGFVSQTSTNPIAKAAALASVRTLTPELLAVVQPQLSSPEPFVRLGAIQVVGRLPLQQRTPLLIDLVRDSSRAVRMEAASLFAGADRSKLTGEQREGLDEAVAEYRKGLSQDADRAEALTALAALQVAEGDPVSARASFETALRRDETSLVTLLNYADFQRAQGNDAAAEPLLSRASALYPDSASVHLALGLLRIRQKRAAEAIPELARAAELAPDESNYAYVYAVGLYSTGQGLPALAVLDKARGRFPASPQIREALRSYCADQRAKGTSIESKAAAICSK